MAQVSNCQPDPTSAAILSLSNPVWSKNSESSIPAPYLAVDKKQKTQLLAGFLDLACRKNEIYTATQPQF
jgi:hypothetical protein